MKGYFKALESDAYEKARRPSCMNKQFRRKQTEKRSSKCKKRQDQLEWRSENKTIPVLS